MYYIRTYVFYKQLEVNGEISATASMCLSTNQPGKYISLLFWPLTNTPVYRTFWYPSDSFPTKLTNCINTSWIWRGSQSFKLASTISFPMGSNGNVRSQILLYLLVAVLYACPEGISGPGEIWYRKRPLWHLGNVASNPCRGHGSWPCVDTA